MSDQLQNPRLRLSVPRGEAIGTFDTYPEAQALVDHLAKAEFDVSSVSIVGNDLKTVERVTGKLTWGRAALNGALNGAFTGIFIMLLLSLFDGNAMADFRFYAAGVLICIGLGLVFGLLSYAIQRRRRDFTSTQQVLASSYQVIVPDQFAEAAKQAAAKVLP